MATKSFLIDKAVLLALQTEALAQSRPGKPVSVSDLIRRALADYLAKLGVKTNG